MFNHPITIDDPIMTIIDLESNQNFLNGTLKKKASQPLYIGCVVDSYPIRDGVWNLSGIPINKNIEKSSKTFSTNQFSIPRLRTSDSGTYSCCLNYSSECKSIQLIVEGNL